MRYTNWAIATMIVAVSAVCIRQPAAPAQATQQESAAPVRDPHSTPADLAVPLCPAKFGDNLETNGIAVPGRGVTPPKIVHSAAAELADEVREATQKARKVGFVSTSLVSLVVDEQGKPQNLCLTRTSGYGLDANAAKAVRQYTFTPATMDGKPVPIRIAIEVNFNFYSPNQ
jgi:TonB family protein